ncbi:hypothetical protein IFR05_010377 [Cadophora sp. M221]|nr:hypothetical protein IFR05_010377 [Cadophora sp. M221]
MDTEGLCFNIASHGDDIFGFDSAMLPQQFNRDPSEELYSNITGQVKNTPDNYFILSHSMFSSLQDDLQVSSHVISSTEHLLSSQDGFDEYGFIATSLADHALSTNPCPLRFSRKFPKEIYLNIISQVDDIPTLAALSLLSKTSHEFAESYLYSTLKTTGHDALPLVMRTILEKPHFGSYVTSWVSSSCSNENICLDALLPEDMSRLSIAANWVYDLAKEHPNYGLVWADHLMNGVWDVLAAIFICLLPNLQELSLVDFGGEGQRLFMETVLRRAAILQGNPALITSEASQIRAGLHRYSEEKGGIENRVKFSNVLGQGSTMPAEFALSKLQRVSISSESAQFPWIGVHPVQTLPYLAIPSVTSFSVHKILDNFDTDDPRDTPGSSYEYPLPDFSFKATELVLTHSIMESYELADYLFFFKQLKRFEYTLYYSPPMEFREVWTPEYLVVPDLVDALDHLCECLEELSITQPNDLNDMDKPREDRPIASLEEFTVLKKIEVSANILLGRPGYAGFRQGELSGEYAYDQKYIDEFPNLLPPSLEELTMRLCEMSAAKAIEKLFDDLPPNLRRIKLELKCELNMAVLHRRSRWKKLQDLSLKNGIELVMALADTTRRGCSTCRGHSTT